MLRQELKKEFLWSRDKIAALASDLEMNETQVYKWWWDQTRKRQKIIKNEQKNMPTTLQNNYESGETKAEEYEVMLPSTDEFGGYSSRLRLQEVYIESKKDDNQNLESNLCQLLGIDIEAMALAIVMEDKKNLS